MNTEKTINEAEGNAVLPLVMCGFCRYCKYYTQDKEYAQVYTCENDKLKLGVIFAFEGGCLGVEPDFGCVQFENRT